MEEDVKGLSDYLDIIRRRKYLVIIPALILMLVTIVIAFSLPATYKSQGLILIESQEIPNDLIRSTVTSYASQRIEVIKQKLMTTSRVMDLVKKYKLYPDLRERKRPVSEFVAEFRTSMDISMVRANVNDPRSGRGRSASIAFTVSFTDKSPQLAQKIADELVTQFLKENVRSRTNRAKETKSFLKEEGNKFEIKVQTLEKKIAEFKDKNSDSLPELLQYNLSMVERLQSELAASQNQIIVLKDQVMTMSLELTSVQPYLNNGQEVGVPGSSSGSPESQLKQAKAEYSRLSAKYSPSHPDLLQLKRQIESLEAELGTGGYSEFDRVSAQLESEKNNLKSLNQRYSPSHPDVKSKKLQIKELENQLKLAKKNDNKTVAKVPSNKVVSPAYIQIKSKIDSNEREIKRLQARQVEMTSKLAEYETRIEKTHQVKRAYDDLTRDYDNNLAKYKELRTKQLEAELAENLESENKGESFTLIEPPTVPSKPEKVNRPKIMIMGVAASLGAGLALALLVEFAFGGLRGYKQITQALGASPLVVLPMITTLQDLQRKRRIKKRILFLLIALFVLTVFIFHFYVMDLEVLWFRIMRKLSLLE